MTLTDWLSGVKGRIEKTTPGPWRVHRDKDGDVDFVTTQAIQPTGCDEEDECYYEIGRAVLRTPVEKYGYGCAWASEPNADFIAHSRTDLETAVRVIEVLRTEVERLNDFLQRDFHQRTCLQARGCHCKEIYSEALAAADRIVTEETTCVNRPK